MKQNVQRQSPRGVLKRYSWKFRKIHRKAPVNFAKLLRTLFYYRTPPAAASNVHSWKFKLKAGYAAKEKESMPLLRF